MIKKRRCIGCNEIKDSKNMIKITKDYKTEEIIINPNNYQIGRSVYVCKDEDCVAAALKKNKLEKCIKKNINENEKENIKTVLNRLVVVKH